MIFKGGFSLTKSIKTDDPFFEINNMLEEIYDTKIDTKKIANRYSKSEKEDFVSCIKNEFNYPSFREKILDIKETKWFEARGIEKAFLWYLGIISMGGKHKSIADFKISFVAEEKKKVDKDSLEKTIGVKLRPILKWVGSKAQLKKEIKEEIEKIASDFVYHEPFLGGGSIAFDMTKKYAILSDYNQDLIEFYEVVRDNPEKLLYLSKRVEKIYNDLLVLNSQRRDFYNKYRKRIDYPFFWSIEKNFHIEEILDEKILRACHFLFLNKCDFNGLYRVNSQGIFNVPWGQKESIRLISGEKNNNTESKAKDEYDNFWKLSNYLKNENVKLRSIDFQDALDANFKDKRKHLFYLDPPYFAEEGKETTFTSYTTKGFTFKDLEKIKELSDKLIEAGHYVIISNHDNVKIKELFSNERYYRIIQNKKDLKVYRSISGTTENRKYINELLIIGQKNG